MWSLQSTFRALATAAETFASLYNFAEMRSNLALVGVGFLSTSQAQCPGYTSYSQVSFVVYMIRWLKLHFT